LLKQVHNDPSGQVALYESEDRYLGLLAKTFGQRFLNYRTRWRETSERGEPGDFPLSLDLAINSGCQLHCLMCPLKSRAEAKRVRLMDEALFHSLIDEAKERRLPALTLGLGSEPLLNPKAAEWTAAAARAGIMDIRLGTNAVALTGDTAKALVASGLTRLEISVDAVTPAAYQKIRGGQLEALERRIENFLNIRTAAAQKFPLLRLSFLKLPQNQGELEPFLTRWQGLADMVSIQEPIWFPGSALPKPTTPGRPIAPHCAQPWQRLAINYDGSVWPCCSWYGEGLLPFNVKHDRVAKIWQSPEIAALRQSLAATPPPACARCEC
jgi:radical SAM protein with 4Fe4S-binding SPASM domain